MPLTNSQLRITFICYLLITCLVCSQPADIARAHPSRVSAGLTVRIEPASKSVQPGQAFTVSVMVDGAVDLGAFQFEMRYDPAVVTASNVGLGLFLGSTGRTAQAIGSDVDNVAGLVKSAAFSFGDRAGPQGTGVLAVITLTAVGSGRSTLSLQNVLVTDTMANVLPASVRGGTVVVAAPTPTPTPTAMPGPTVTSTARPVPTSAATAAVTAEPVTTATPTEAATARSETTATAAATPVATRTATPVPSVTPVPVALATPTLAETSEPEPTAMATRTPSPLPTPTARVLLSASPVPSASPTAGPHRPPCCLPVGGIALAVPGWMLCALLRRYGK